MLIIELDYETKKAEEQVLLEEMKRHGETNVKKTKKIQSIFSGRSGIYEKHRSRLIQPEIVITYGMFQNERNISQALEKHNALPDVGQLD